MNKGEVKALQAVAGSLSWIAWQCRPDEAENASILQGPVSRVVVEDLSDANQLKQTEDVGLLIHAIPLVTLRTVSISDAALDLNRPAGSTQGGFMVGSNTSEIYQQGSAVTLPMSWSPHKVKRTSSASLAGEVFVTSEELADSEWIIGVLESAVYQDYDIPLHRWRSITFSVESKVTVMKTDSGRSNRPQCAPSMQKVLSIILVRELTGGHCRRTVQELCVIRRSVQTLKARSRWVPHERMVVDALTKRYRNSITSLQLLREGILPIVDGGSGAGEPQYVPGKAHMFSATASTVGTRTNWKM